MTEADGSQTLTIFSGDDRIFVKDFTDGKLGITLGVSAPVVLPPAEGSYALTPQRPWFDGTASEGSLSVDGSATMDNIYGGKAADLLQGHGEWDQLYGREGDDRIYGDAVIDAAAAIAAATQDQPAAQSDWLSGGSGNDLIIASAGYVFGGSGRDRIIGGGAKDVIEADGTPQAADFYITGSPLGYYDQVTMTLDYGAPSVSFYYSLYHNGTPDNFARLSAEIADTVPGGNDDTIITGAGNDIVLADLGDDYLSLGSGDDWGIGGAGADIIDGGSGDDLLFGDFNWDDGPAPAFMKNGSFEKRVG